MQREIEIDRKTFYCDYDEYQDTLFITFSKELGLTYYEPTLSSLYIEEI